MSSISVFIVCASNARSLLSSNAWLFSDAYRTKRTLLSSTNSLFASGVTCPKYRLISAIYSGVSISSRRRTTHAWSIPALYLSRPDITIAAPNDGLLAEQLTSGTTTARPRGLSVCFYVVDLCFRNVIFCWGACRWFTDRRYRCRHTSTARRRSGGRCWHLEGMAWYRRQRRCLLLLLLLLSTLMDWFYRADVT